jgi:hypothetical protein
LHTCKHTYATHVLDSWIRQFARVLRFTFRSRLLYSLHASSRHLVSVWQRNSPIRKNRQISLRPEISLGTPRLATVRSLRFVDIAEARESPLLSVSLSCSKNVRASIGVSCESLKRVNNPPIDEIIAIVFDYPLLRNEDGANADFFLFRAWLIETASLKVIGKPVQSVIRQSHDVTLFVHSSIRAALSFVDRCRLPMVSLIFSFPVRWRLLSDSILVRRTKINVYRGSWSIVIAQCAAARVAFRARPYYDYDILFI